MKQNEPLFRQQTIDQLKSRLQNIASIQSISIVGSFWQKQSLAEISDIDVIVIVDTLTATIFQQIETQAKQISASDLGVPNYACKLNMTFGPLKMNDHETIVFHLMVYDVAGHKKHVEESPFTCYDWEKQDAIYGKNLRDIYSASPLQLNDLLHSRRSIQSYLADFEAAKITYRFYAIENEKLVEQTATHAMDARHQMEYAYHTMRFMLLNLLKILKQTNLTWNDAALIENCKALGIISDGAHSFFETLSHWKHQQNQAPENTKENLSIFLNELETQLKSFAKESVLVDFYRHAKTKDNDGTFLGIGRNPDIDLPLLSDFAKTKYDCIFCSKLLRSIATAKCMQADEVSENVLLNEINYGQAEGLQLAQLQNAFPEMIIEWQKGNDPAFPGGESQMDVAKRLANFVLQELLVTKNKKIAVVTHNVVLRVLLGKTLGLPLHKWHPLQIAHLQKLSFQIVHQHLIPQFGQQERILLRERTIEINNQA